LISHQHLIRVTDLCERRLVERAKGDRTSPARRAGDARPDLVRGNRAGTIGSAGNHQSQAGEVVAGKLKHRPNLVDYVPAAINGRIYRVAVADREWALGQQDGRGVRG